LKRVGHLPLVSDCADETDNREMWW